MIRASPVAARTSRNRAGKLVRPLASMACSKCPRNMFPPLDPIARGPSRHYLPLYPTNHGTEPAAGVSIGPPWPQPAEHLIRDSLLDVISPLYMEPRARGPGARRRPSSSRTSVPPSICHAARRSNVTALRQRTRFESREIAEWLALRWASCGDFDLDPHPWI